ncbi:MAG TPA: hypothetical protein VK213_03945 [Bacteroidales bacterium]|nr:hypothetical protein [Bacteroidales bacterium]
MKTIIELKELSPQELVEIDGGWVLSIIALVFPSATWLDDFASGFGDAYNHTVREL